MLSIRNLRVGRAGQPIALLADAEVPARQPALLLGPSGSGKSTALFTLAGLLAPLGGEAWLDDTPLTAARPRPDPRVAIMFQDMHLMSGLSARDNVRLGAFARSIKADEVAVEGLLGDLGLTAMADRPAETLSRGEAQRLALARALLLKPRLLLADEPTASLDDANAAAVADLLAATARTTDAALIVATHDRRLIDRFPRHLELVAA